MTHPDEQTKTVLLRRLVHRTVAIIVEPLCPLGKLLSTLRLAISLLHDVVERFTTLGALQCIIMLPPGIALWPQMLRFHHSAQRLEGRHIRHTTL